MSEKDGGQDAALDGAERSVASIVFAVVVLGGDLSYGETISALVTVTVLLSIVAHGVTANPWARAFGARAAARSSDA